MQFCEQRGHFDFLCMRTIDFLYCNVSLQVFENVLQEDKFKRPIFIGEIFRSW
jgi:hypothetical protein